jgi:hypothetical protein
MSINLQSYSASLDYIEACSQNRDAVFQRSTMLQLADLRLPTANLVQLLDRVETSCCKVLVSKVNLPPGWRDQMLRKSIQEEQVLRLNTSPACSRCFIRYPSYHSVLC